MSKRNRRHYQTKPGQQIVTEKRDVAREMAILNRPAADFANERVVTQFLERIQHASDTEAVKLALALQAFLRGDAAMLNNMDDPAIQASVNKQLEDAAKYDAYAQKFDQDKDAFIEEMCRLYDQHRPTGANLDKAIAQGATQFQRAQQMAQAQQTSARLQLEARLANDPKVLVNIPLRYQTVKQGEAYVQAPINEEVRILHKHWVFEPGDHLVPQVLADRIREIQRGRAESEKRKQAMLLSGNRSMAQMEQAQRNIDREFGTKRQAVPVREEM